MYYILLLLMLLPPTLPPSPMEALEQKKRAMAASNPLLPPSIDQVPIAPTPQPTSYYEESFKAPQYTEDDLVNHLRSMGWGTVQKPVTPVDTNTGQPIAAPAVVTAQRAEDIAPELHDPQYKELRNVLNQEGVHTPIAQPLPAVTQPVATPAVNFGGVGDEKPVPEKTATEPAKPSTPAPAAATPADSGGVVEKDGQYFFPYKGKQVPVRMNGNSVEVQDEKGAWNAVPRNALGQRIAASMNQTYKEPWKDIEYDGKLYSAMDSEGVTYAIDDDGKAYTYDELGGVKPVDTSSLPEALRLRAEYNTRQGLYYLDSGDATPTSVKTDVAPDPDMVANGGTFDIDENGQIVGNSRLAQMLRNNPALAEKVKDDIRANMPGILQESNDIRRVKNLIPLAPTSTPTWFKLAEDAQAAVQNPQTQNPQNPPMPKVTGGASLSLQSNTSQAAGGTVPTVDDQTLRQQRYAKIAEDVIRQEAAQPRVNPDIWKLAGKVGTLWTPARYNEVVSANPQWVSDGSGEAERLSPKKYNEAYMKALSGSPDDVNDFLQSYVYPVASIMQHHIGQKLPEPDAFQYSQRQPTASSGMRDIYNLNFQQSNSSGSSYSFAKQQSTGSNPVNPQHDIFSVTTTQRNNKALGTILGGRTAVPFRDIKGTLTSAAVNDVARTEQAQTAFNEVFGVDAVKQRRIANQVGAVVRQELQSIATMDSASAAPKRNALHDTYKQYFNNMQEALNADPNLYNRVDSAIKGMGLNPADYVTQVNNKPQLNADKLYQAIGVAKKGGRSYIDSVFDNIAENAGSGNASEWLMRDVGTGEASLYYETKLLSKSKDLLTTGKIPGVNLDDTRLYSSPKVYSVFNGAQSDNTAKGALAQFLIMTGVLQNSNKKFIQ